LNKQQRNNLNSIIKDTTSGSSELADKINYFFIQNSNDIKLIKNAASLLKKHLDHFAAVKKYLENVFTIISDGSSNKLIKFLNSYEESESKKCEKIAEHFKANYKNVNRVLTISRSGTILNVFRYLQQKNKSLRITVLESRPALEGRQMAKSLIEAGIKVELITDAMMSFAVHKADAVVIGADNILKTGIVVNKVGSSLLALLCREFNKPFIVLSTKAKFSNQKLYNPKKEIETEVWDYHHTYLTVTNIYFEEINKNLITEIITE
jgi:translation initiation factor 2B subunit (eIF-2B alpha/beta/delta family)